MIVIGSFTKDENDAFDGWLLMLGINVKARIVPTLMQEKSAPPFRVLGEGRQIGIAWRTLSKNCRRMDLVVQLDDPGFRAPVVATLTEAEEDSYSLIWARERKARAKY